MTIPSASRSPRSPSEDVATDEGLGESVLEGAETASSEPTSCVATADDQEEDEDEVPIGLQIGSSGHPKKPMILKLHLLLNGKQVFASAGCLLVITVSIFASHVSYMCFVLKDLCLKTYKA